jgi:hypothetical protein
LDLFRGYTSGFFNKLLVKNPHASASLDLTKSSGYPQNPDGVTEEALEEVFRTYPEFDLPSIISTS